MDSLIKIEGKPLEKLIDVVSNAIGNICKPWQIVREARAEEKAESIKAIGQAKTQAILDAVDLDTVRCLVLTGAGDKSFVAGADIGEMSSLTKAEGEAFGKKGNDVFRKLETFPIPVIAAVNGFALGGG